MLLKGLTEGTETDRVLYFVYLSGTHILKGNSGAFGAGACDLGWGCGSCD